MLVSPAWGESFTNLLTAGDAAARKADVSTAAQAYERAGLAASGNSAELCVLTRHFCDLMYETTEPDRLKSLAQAALTCARQAETANPSNATARLCVAVCYAKNFPYVDAGTKVNWSKALKAECETAIKLDPRQDVGYYLLGRWNYETANMNIFYKGLVKLVYGGLPKASNEAAIGDFKQAIALAPGRIIHHVALAKVYDTTGQKKLAVTELEKCRGLKPVDRADVDAQKEAATMLAQLHS